MAVNDFITKTCTKCGELKQESLFYKKSSGGTRSVCKKCSNLESTKNRLKDPNKSKKIRREYYLNNIERHKELNKKWREDNRDYLKEQSAKWYLENIEILKITRQKYRDEHRLERRAASAIRYRQMPEKYMEYWRTRRALKLKCTESFTHNQIQELYSKQRGKCISCKEKLNNKYHADHITPLSKGGENGITNIQLLCAICNLKKARKDPIEYMQQIGYLL